MRRFTTVLMIVALTLVATAAMAQVRGKARLQGNVVDAETGKPIGGAKVTIALADGSTAPIVVKANDKGRWSALGLINGQWNVDVEAEGYEPARKGPVAVAEMQMLPAMKIEMTKAVVQQQEETTTVETGSSIPQEVVDAVNLGQEYLAAGKYKEAIVELEKAVPALPDNMQLKQVLAQAYYKDGNLKKAIELLEIVSAADASNTGVALLITNLYLEDGRLEEAKARLATLPADAVTDPTVYTNIGILFLNKGNPNEAAEYFGKAVEMDMTRPESFYYRGLALLQQKKMKEAKADFEKVLELAPESSEGRDAKQLLESMK